MLFSGVVQFILGKLGCADHDEDVISPCPLPKSFNHNALFHLMIILDAVLFFAAEYLAIQYRLKT